jgi:putative PEP-CTERM system TPR-repeat lipoprotein
MNHLRIRPCTALVAALLVAGACRHDPVADARRFTKNADAYMAAKRWKEAVIEYGNAIKAQPEDADAYYKRAQAYAAIGDPKGAYTAYARAADLNPANVDAQLKAGTLLLAAGQYEAARSRAELALAADDKSAAAHILLGNALAGLNSPARALEQIEEAIRLDPDSTSAWTALGAARYRNRQVKEARAAFDQAIALDPGSSDARLSLANILWATGDVAAAERQMQQALSRHPDDRLVRRTLVAFYLSIGRVAEAEPHLKILADDEPGRLQLADYYIQAGRLPDARAVLDPLAKSSVAATSRDARLRLASIQYSTGDKTGAYRAIDQLIADKPHRIEARLAKTRMLLQDGDAAHAAAEAAEALKRDSGSAEAHYLAGLAAVARGDAADAERSFQQVITINPRAAAAHLQLARLELARGEPEAAVTAATQAAALAPADPGVTLVLARSLRAKGDLKGAEEYLKKPIAEQPGQAAFHVELGWVELAERRFADAAGSFTKALDLEPSSPEARDGLTAVDVATGRTATARERVNRWIARDPSDGHLRLLSAKLSLVAGDSTGASRVLEQLVVASPDQLEAYGLLGQVYASGGQIPEAIAQYQALASRSRTPAGALTMIGLLEEARNNRSAARTTYEKALAADRNAPTAANNLAWMYASDGKFDAALRLGEEAERLLPKRPEPKDTVGWIKYQQGSYWEAAEWFDKAVSAAPERALYHYHLGLARLHDGRADEASKSLHRALELGLTGREADDARQALQRATEARRR